MRYYSVTKKRETAAKKSAIKVRLLRPLFCSGLVMTLFGLSVGRGTRRAVGRGM